ncbi:MAG: acyltransferase family protein, partial [Hyphomicrobiales bacterium]|nr:acyltransferase family protein [Hyphomicrobiales bacterium]
MFQASFADRLDVANNRPTGFDYMRITLSISVLVFHSFAVSYGIDAHEPLSNPAKPFVSAILPAFFSLSGFLVAGSLYRSRGLTTFFGLRVLRIVPALAVEVIISALLLGPLLTTLPLEEYFRDPKFAAYFWN